MASSFVVLEEHDPCEVDVTPTLHGHHPYGKKAHHIRFLTSSEEDAIREKALSVARTLTSQIGVQEDDGSPRQGAIISIAIFYPRSDATHGTCKVWSLQCAPPISVLGAQNKAYTAAMLSGKHAAISTHAFNKLSKEGGVYEHYASSVESKEYRLSRVEGGIPIYRDGHCIGGLGIDGDSGDVCGQIAYATLSTALSESLMAPRHIWCGRFKTVAY